MRLVILACLALAACGSPTPQAADEKPPTAETTKLAPIDPGVFRPYTREGGWNKTIDSWGSAGIKRVQALREEAARTAAANPKCDAVELSEISGSRSRPPTRPVVYVDCKNGERFYLSESDVGSALTSEIDKGKRFSSAELITRCTEEVRAQLSLPSTFDQSMFSVSDRQGTTGNRVVEFNFTAKNRLGLELPASARCIMTTQGQFEVTVIER